MILAHTLSHLQTITYHYILEFGRHILSWPLPQHASISTDVLDTLRFLLCLSYWSWNILKCLIKGTSSADGGKKKRKDSSNKIIGESFAVEMDSPASAPKWNENWNGYKFQKSESQTAVLKSDVTSCHALRPSVPRLPEVPGTHLCVQWHLVTKKMKGKSLGHFERGSPPTSSRYSSRTNMIDFGSSLRPTYSCSKAQTLPPCHVNV